MARKRKRRSNSSRGGTFTGIIIGLILGLVAAVAVALYVTQAPMPFFDRASREPNEIILPDVRDAPDPNQHLYRNNSELPTDTKVPTPTPQQQQDELGQFIAGLDQLETVPKGSEAPVPPEPSTSAQPQSSEAPRSDTKAPDQNTVYFLQAGAFRSAQDADNVKAQILLLGLDATVAVGEHDGAPINRVRVGPFTGIDELNKARAKLGEEKIESSVIRP